MEADEEYFTHPDRMRGATGRKQNAMMHQQLKSFETMLHTFLERHETSSLYRALARVVPYNRRVRSLHALNHYANQWYSDRDNSHVNDQTTIKHIEAFNQEIKHLKQMKTLFDDRIYSVLFEFYYEMVMEEIPQATKLVERGRRASSEVRGSNLLVMSNIEGYAALNESMPVEKLYDISKDCEKLFGIIHQLQQVDVRWGSLLKSEEVDLELFDPDSVYDVKLYPNYLRFEAVLRLIPDVLRKTQSAIELAKSWWYQAERIRRRLRGQKIRDDTTSDQPPENDHNHIDESLKEDKPTTEQVPKDGHLTKSRQMSRHRPEATPDHDEYTSYQDPDYRRTNEVDNPLHSRATPEQKHVIPRHTYPAVMETVERRLKELSTSIALGQMDLAAETSELEFFNRRQQRIRKLRSNLKRAINAMEAMHDELKGHRREKEQLLLRLEDDDDLSERRHITGKLKTVDDKVKDIQELSQVIDYRHKLMTSDLKLELDLKETFTRYQNEVSGRVDLLQSSVRDEEEKRAQLAHELNLLRLQAGLDEQEQEDMQDKRRSNKANQHGDQISNGRSVPRVPKNQAGSVPWLSLDESYRMEDEMENRDSFSPDLLLGQAVDSSWDREGLSDDGQPLNMVSSSPDLLNHKRRISVDNGVNKNRFTNRGYLARPRESKRKPSLTYQMPHTGGNDYDRFTDNSNRPSNKTEDKRNSVPEINYFPPSPKGKKKHRSLKAPEKPFSDEYEDVDDPSGYMKNGYNRQEGPYEDTDTSFRPHRSRDEETDGQRRRPPAPSLDSEQPTRTFKRRPRKSLGLNKKGAPVQKHPPLPQLREEDGPSPAPRKGQPPRMYDPKRESFDSILSSQSPLPLNSYTPLSFDRGGKGELGGGGGSRKGKKAQRSQPKNRSDQPDLLSPLNKANQTQRRKQPQVSRIPLKTTY